MRRSILVVVCILAVFLIGLTTYGKSEAASGRGKAAPGNMLPKELMNLDIKDEFVRYAGKEAGVIQTVTGHVVVAHENKRQAYFAAAGDRLYEKDVVFTLKQSRCRFKMHHEDVVTMGENTRIGITSYTDNKKTQEKRSSFDMAKGKAMFYTLRLFKHKGAAMEVKTITAVVGVRGTKFGVEVIELDGTTKASLPVLVADLSDAGFMHLAQATQPSVQTNVHTFEGAVAVTSTTTGQTTTLGAGQSLNVGVTGLGNTFATPPSVSQQFQSDTSAGPPASGGAGGGTPGSGTAPAGGDTGTTGTASTYITPPDTSTVTQQQSTTKTESTATDPVTDPGTNASGRSTGYFTGMLTNKGGSRLQELFISTKRQTFGWDNNLYSIWARGSKASSTDYARAGGSGTGTSDYLKWVVFDSGTSNSGDLGTSHQISHPTLGRADSAPLEWGYWTIPDAFTVGGVSYVFDNKGYWINGTNTPSMSGFTGTAGYSGSAYGTYWSSSGGVDMTGSFDCGVNFSTAAISNFALNVSGSGKSATISGASGTFNNDATFNITGGSWNLNGYTPDYQSCQGSFYGSDAKYMGGAWGMVHTASNTGAEGIFSGNAAHYGYFTGMLTCNSAGSISFDNFSSTLTRQSFYSNTIKGEDPTSSIPYVLVDGTTNYQDPKITWLQVSSGSGGSQNVQVQHVKIDANSYMEWGSWTQPSAMSIAGDSATYYYDNKGHYIYGDYTTDAQMLALKNQSLSATYSGNAYGTYWTSGGGANMTGSFGTSVNFAASSSQISNFNVSVAGGGHTTEISGATGSFSGSSSEFSVNTTTGSWKIDGASVPTYKKAGGSVYGSSGQAIGGIWGVKNGSDRATGIFQGTR
ncbi:MAG: FecR family protein [Deltaproteobacteria bacterium]|nr:FecR family protein [Deltaproteobacteria bacterium]